MSRPSSLSAIFDIYHRTRMQSPALELIWKTGFGDTYPVEAKPNGFYPQAVLDRIISTFGDSVKSQILLDVGTGHGGTGVYLAKKLGMKMHGIDLSPEGIELAKKAAQAAGLREAEFYVADATSTGLHRGSCAAAVSFDVLLFIPDKLAALNEIARVLKSGGLFAFTTWAQDGFNPRLNSEQIGDYRPLLRDAGFEIVAYERLEDAEASQKRTFDGLIAQERVLRDKIGDQATSMLVDMARAGLKESTERVYVFGIARKIEN
jgi:ubiquinone/menaquinone biosynthesis C-methylase UbiE